MDLLIDPASAVPIYAQVVDQVRRQVAAGGLATGDKLPSVRDLAASLRINRNTAAKAYQLLEVEGVLESRAGQGTFIAAGGSRWSSEERLRRVAASLDQALVEAYHLEVPLSELPDILRRRIEAFTDGSEKAAPAEDRRAMADSHEERQAKERMVEEHPADEDPATTPGRTSASPTNSQRKGGKP